VVAGRSTLFDSEQFVRDDLAEGARWITDTKIVRLHGSSESHRHR
jgi:hypothetical protein